MMNFLTQSKIIWWGIPLFLLIIGCQPALDGIEVTRTQPTVTIQATQTQPTATVQVEQTQPVIILPSPTPQPSATPIPSLTPLPPPTNTPPPTATSITDLRPTVQPSQQETSDTIATPYAHGLLTFVQNDQLMTTDPNLVNAPVTSEACCQGIWSSDGNFALFTDLRPENMEAFIHWIDREGTRQTISIQPYLHRSPAWSPDSRSFAFLVHTGVPWGEYSDSWLTNGALEELWVATINDTGQLERLEKIADVETPGLGCGGAGYSHSDGLFQLQLGKGRGGLSMVWTAQNMLVYRLNCGDSPGYGRFDMNTIEALSYHPATIRMLHLDPQQTHWIGIDGSALFGEESTNRLVTGQLDSTDYEILETSAPVHTINVGAISGRIYYTSRRPMGQEELTIAMPDARSPYFNFYHTQLWVIDADGTNEHLLWESEVHSITRVTETPAGDILFVMVENDKALFDAINNDIPQTEWHEYDPQTHIMRLSPFDIEPVVWVGNAGYLSLWLNNIND